MIDEKKLIDELDKIPFQVEMSREVNKTRPFVDIANVFECVNNQPKFGEWTKCTKRLPTIEECWDNDCRFIVTDGNRRYERNFDYISKRFVHIDDNLRSTEDRCVIA